MLSSVLTFVAVGASQASAHFSIVYPPWRGNSMIHVGHYSQYTYPCASIPSDPNANRTAWPLTGGGGIVELQLHHPWTYLFINLGLVDDSEDDDDNPCSCSASRNSISNTTMTDENTNFNISLTPKLTNITGAGTYCTPPLHLPIPDELNFDGTDEEEEIELMKRLYDGRRATLQVVTTSENGVALYNCADIVLRANATQHQCRNSTDFNVTMGGNSQIAPDKTGGVGRMVAAVLAPVTMLLGLWAVYIPVLV